VIYYFGNKIVKFPLRFLIRAQGVSYVVKAVGKGLTPVKTFVSFFLIVERQRIMSDSQTLVVKLGTSVLTGGSRRLNRAHIVELVRQCAQLHAAGHRIVIVTSGAIAAGREHGLPRTPRDDRLQTAAGRRGQSRLIQLWEQLFSIYGIHVGQMLLTRADMEDRERFLNARDTLRALLDNNIVPVINENDAVATAEIKVGDNDNLSALAAILAGADKLLLLTDQQGLFTADPRNNPEAELIKDVHGIDDALRAIAGDSVSGLGTGGMGTKLQAADVACRAGIDTIIAAGSRPGVIGDVMEGVPSGRRFHAQESPLENRKRWILARLLQVKSPLMKGRPPRFWNEEVHYFQKELKA
jgi:glutamate 5-kinase